jgi:hypothetical protein
MCDKCVELDGKIAHYLGIASRGTDEAMIRGINVLIARAKGTEGGTSPGANEVRLQVAPLLL